MLQDLFPSYKRMMRVLRRLVLKKKIKQLGMVLRNHSGHPEIVYGTRRSGKLEHDVELADFLLLYPEPTINRLNVPFNADAEMYFISGRRFFVEWDSGELSGRQVVSRWKQYRSLNNQDHHSEFLLVIAKTPERINWFLERDEDVRNIAVYSTMEWVRKNPTGKVWMDRDQVWGILR